MLGAPQRIEFRLGDGKIEHVGGIPGKGSPPPFPTADIFMRIFTCSTKSEPGNVLYRIQRGLVGYISYLAACEMNQAFSEYVLYEPMLRILSARGYVAECEFICPGLPERTGSGDKKRIDFSVEGRDLRMGIEVKWAKNSRIDVEDDLSKLRSFKSCVAGSRCFLCVFGRESHVEAVTLSNADDFDEAVEPVFALLRATKYGCRFFEVKDLPQ